jgi:molybdopterin converting factor small subunit
MVEIEVEVKLFASLSEYMPKTPRKRIPANSTVNDLLGALGLPADGRYIVLVNTLPEWDRHRVLAAGDGVAIFPPLAGG